MLSEAAHVFLTFSVPDSLCPRPVRGRGRRRNCQCLSFPGVRNMTQECHLPHGCTPEKRSSFCDILAHPQDSALYAAFSPLSRFGSAECGLCAIPTFSAPLASCRSGDSPTGAVASDSLRVDDAGDSVGVGKRRCANAGIWRITDRRAALDRAHGGRFCLLYRRCRRTDASGDADRSGSSTVIIDPTSQSLHSALLPLIVVILTVESLRLPGFVMNVNHQEAGHDLEPRMRTRIACGSSGDARPLSPCPVRLPL